MKDFELTPEEDARFTAERIRERGAADPASLSDVVTLASLGLTNGTWRNSCVEDWHAGDGPLSDGDMMRVNSETSYGVRRRVVGWLRENGLSVRGATADLDGLDAEALEQLAVRLFRWFTRPERLLATGMTLAELADAAGGSLEEYTDHADLRLGGFLAGGEKRGVAHTFLHAASHGAGACEAWWGHPRWPARVDAFLTAVGDPEHRLWGENGIYLTQLPPVPDELRDAAAARRVLLNHPWRLAPSTADWITWAGIRYVKQ